MSVTTSCLVDYSDQLLSAAAFSDYCPNGLQVQGGAQIYKLVCGVTANLELIERAIDSGADALLVHHGIFWQGDDAAAVGVKYRRLQALIKHDINLVAYHLPLDAHPLYGNNAQLAQRLGIVVEGGMEAANPHSVGSVGRLSPPLSAAEFCERVEEVLQRPPLLIDGGNGLIERIAWCSGAAQGMIEQAAKLGVDAYLSGEISEPTVHLARELGLHYIAAGHHATERYGVQALGEHLAEKFSLDYQYIEVACPA